MQIILSILGLILGAFVVTGILLTSLALIAVRHIERTNDKLIEEDDKASRK